MNSIDTIEGIVREIIDRSFEDLESDARDDSDYIRNIKTVLTAVETFFKNNVEITTTPDSVIRQILYDYAKEKWMDYKLNGQDDRKKLTNEMGHSNNREYLNFYFDYIYDRGVYPL